jgi:uncharacterized membrane protein
MTVLKYGLLWLLSFAFTSLIDAAWHLGIFGRVYAADFKPLARVADGKMTFNAPAGLLSQVLVVTTLGFLVLFRAGRGTALEAAIVGAAAGILAISVYGVTNYALLRGWTLRLTILEGVWGPLIGGLSGLFIFWLRGRLFR